MKKLVLAVLLVVMIFTPCMAEVEPEGLFGVEGTYWSGTVIAGVPQTNPLDIAFSGGIMYLCNVLGCYPDYVVTGSYTDILLLTFFNANMEALAINGILIPFLGIGWGLNTFIYGDFLYPILLTYTKTSDNWTLYSEYGDG